MFSKFRNTELHASVTGWSDYRFCWEGEEGVREKNCARMKRQWRHMSLLWCCTHDGLWDRAMFSDCYRQWAKSKWKAKLGVKPGIQAGQSGGTEGRNGAIMGGLEADPWHCLCFKKIINAVSLWASCLSWELCIASWMECGAKKMEKLKHQRLCHSSKITQEGNVMSELTNHRVFLASYSQLWPSDASLSSVPSQTWTLWPRIIWSDLKGRVSHF